MTGVHAGHGAVIFNPQQNEPAFRIGHSDDSRHEVTVRQPFEITLKFNRERFTSFQQIQDFRILIVGVKDSHFFLLLFNGNYHGTSVSRAFLSALKVTGGER